MQLKDLSPLLKVVAFGSGLSLIIQSNINYDVFANAEGSYCQHYH